VGHPRFVLNGKGNGKGNSKCDGSFASLRMTSTGNGRGGSSFARMNPPMRYSRMSGAPDL
jgi:hypothetical protein